MERFIWKGRAFALKYEFGGGVSKEILHQIYSVL